VILPVVHVESQEQALRNADVAFNAGCDGVFLINHAVSSGRLLEIFGAVQAAFENRWIGVNCLDLKPTEVFRTIPAEVAGVWVDDAGIDERQEKQPFAEVVSAECAASGWAGLYFGGVAFKYQRTVTELATASEIASRHMDIVTTSGPGTGQSASREKIATMKQAMGEHPLAIASGITPSNVTDYLDVADCFLVATGISKSFTDLDKTLVRSLVERVRAYDA